VKNKNIIPGWVLKIRNREESDYQIGDIYHILNYRSVTSISEFNGIKWISFKFHNIEECRKRFAYF